MSSTTPNAGPSEETPSAVDCAAACRTAVVRLGGGFMLGAPVTAAAAEMELSFIEFYLAGRCGVLGAAPGPVVAAALTFFEPDFAITHWTSALQTVTAEDGALRYLEACRDTGRQRWADRTDLARPIELLARVAAAADLSGLPLAAGWTALPRADDEAGQLAQLLQVLREQRGGVHAIATLACGLSPLESILTSADAKRQAAYLGWTDPLPEVTPELRRTYERAERLTDELAGPAYAVLSGAGTPLADGLVRRGDGVAGSRTVRTRR